MIVSTSAMKIIEAKVHVPEMCMLKRMYEVDTKDLLMNT